jgi:hypothetical protein
MAAVWMDPIVEEVREAGDRLARAAGYDLHEFCRQIREHQQQYADRLVNLPPRRLKDVAVGSDPASQEH